MHRLRNRALSFTCPRRPRPLYPRPLAQLIYPFAGAVDTELPKPPHSVHIMLKYKAAWVEPQVRVGYALCWCARSACTAHA